MLITAQCYYFVGFLLLLKKDKTSCPKRKENETQIFEYDSKVKLTRPLTMLGSNANDVIDSEMSRKGRFVVAAFNDKNPFCSLLLKSVGISPTGFEENGFLFQKTASNCTEKKENARNFRRKIALSVDVILTSR